MTPASSKMDGEVVQIYLSAVQINHSAEVGRLGTCSCRVQHYILTDLEIEKEKFLQKRWHKRQKSLQKPARTNPYQTFEIWFVRIKRHGALSLIIFKTVFHF